MNRVENKPPHGGHDGKAGHKRIDQTQNAAISLWLIAALK
jgi:hypothetical protein